MNRLILIGNGFDLAHRLKTDYNSFIIWYLKNCFEEVAGGKDYGDELIHISQGEYPLQHNHLPGLKNVFDFIDHYYQNDFLQLLKPELKFKGWQNIYPNPFEFKINSSLFEVLITKCNDKNWVDVENEFYELLKSCYDHNNKPNLEEINELNNSLKCIIRQLEIYLSSLECKKHSATYSDILSSEIQVEEIINSNLESNELPNSSLVLNFNYTKTVEGYFGNNPSLPRLLSSIDTNYIHGQINFNQNPLIFGFGDELDEDYKKMELAKANGFFEYIKSFWYFKTSNYHNLIRFIESTDYQIYILGHSCGLSDRTLLNMVFEHQNCKSIKIYYHGDKQQNNFTHLTQEISRHFKDKVAMRRKIVPFDKSYPMPQVV